MLSEAKETENPLYLTVVLEELKNFGVFEQLNTK